MRNIFEWNLGRELTDPANSQISIEIEFISLRLTEQNNAKMTHIEEPLNSKFEGLLEQIRTNTNYNVTTDKQEVESKQPGLSNSKGKGLRRKHASNTAIERVRDQDDQFYSSEMSELRQPYTSQGISNETLDETKIINENGQEAGHHRVTGPPKNILRQSSLRRNSARTSSNIRRRLPNCISN